MAKVLFNGHKVSDRTVKDVLQSICLFFEKNVIVTSGDRNSVPSGGSKTSLHLLRRAVDFHIEGLSDSVVYQQLKQNVVKIFLFQHSYELIQHGVYTKTEGAHLHLGLCRSTAGAGEVEFKTEGLTASGAGQYKTDVVLPIIGYNRLAVQALNY